jgi:hypothetical protein
VWAREDVERVETVLRPLGGTPCTKRILTLSFRQSGGVLSGESKVTEKTLTTNTFAGRRPSVNSWTCWSSFQKHNITGIYEN